MNKDITTLIEESLWNDRDGILRGALGEIIRLRTLDKQKDEKLENLVDAVEFFMSSVNDYFESVSMHEVELLRRRMARHNATNSELIEEVGGNLAEIINSSGVSGSLESSVRMAAEQMKEASDLVGALSLDARKFIIASRPARQRKDRHNTEQA